MIATAKLFRNGASQAVRLPKEFRFDDVDEVCIKRVGTAVLIFPRGEAWELMGSAMGQADADFLAEREQPQTPDPRKPIGRGKRRGR